LCRLSSKQLKTQPIRRLVQTLLNAPGGIAGYARRLGPPYQQIAASTPEHAPWDETIIAKVEAQRRELLPAEALGQRSVWRDQQLMALARHKQAMARRKT